VPSVIIGARAVNILGTLPDATSYPARKGMNIAAKEIVVTVTDNNYQKLAQ
jgi:hypothetical protein